MIDTAAAVTQQQTPGQIASDEQTAITKDRFFSVFTQEIVDSWNIHWEVFQDTAMVFDAPQKRVAIRNIEERFKKFKGPVTTDFLTLSGQVAQIKRQMEVVHETRLEQVALEYFAGLFPQARVEISEKTGGVQLGLKIRVQLADQVRVYHVKTHAEGRLQENSTAAKMVDAKELFVYKLLEFLGIGPMAYFFQRSPEDFYIATLDASMDPKSQQPGEFLTFDLWKAQAELLPKLVGFFSTLKLANLKEVDRIETEAQSDRTAQKFMHDVMKLDLLSRILRLGDTTTNPANFGFNHFPAHVCNICLIDFRVPDKKEPLIVTQDNVGGFLEGNGEFNYNGEHPGVKYALHNRSRVLRVVSALDILGTDFAKFAECADAAHKFIYHYIGTAEVLKQKADELITELDRYRDAVKQNFSFFENRLRFVLPTTSEHKRPRDQM